MNYTHYKPFIEQRQIASSEDIEQLQLCINPLYIILGIYFIDSHVIINIMQDSIRHSLRVNLQSRRNGAQIYPLPNIQNRKHSLSIQTESKHHSRFTKFHQQYQDSYLVNTTPKEQIHQSIFTVPKNVYFLNNKMIMRNQQNRSKHKAANPYYQSVTKEIQTLDQIQKTQISQEQILFNAVINDFGLIQKQQLIFKQNHPKKSHKKRQSEREESKQGKKLEFFNIEKLSLLNADKIKKSTSAFVKANDQSLMSRNIKELQANIVRRKSILFLDCTHLANTIEVEPNNEEQRIKTLELKPSRLRKRQNLFSTLRQSKQKEHKYQRKKFIIPYDTYPYRDFLWKANYTNRRFVQAPSEYEKRIKVYIGKGNNSCMVSGLIGRRPWCTFTDRIDQANFVWTQLKQLTYFKQQQPYKGQLSLQQRGDKYKAGSILTEMDSIRFQAYFSRFMNCEQRIDQQLSFRQKQLGKKVIKYNQLVQTRMQNHLINNYVLGNKKALFNTLSTYYKHEKQDVFGVLPLTFHIKDGAEDPKYLEFLRFFHKRAKEANAQNNDSNSLKQYNAWIVKPGENSNRGHGIKMCLTLEQIKSIIKKRQRYKDGSYRTFIIQQYIQRPLLYNKRKFDLRHYIMMTSINGIIKGYWYKQGYVRTTSSEYCLTTTIGSIHLTNDAVQKHLPDYGKYQKGNKISYEQLSAYIDKHCRQGKSFEAHIYPRMKKIATDAINACSASIDPNKLQNNFEVFGMDFMIDANLDVWLIQINTNPCLELSCPLLASIIPKMVQNALELTLDAMFPPPVNLPSKGIHFQKDIEKQNKFQLVFDERIQQPFDAASQILDKKLLEEEEDTFEDCGQNWEDK